MSFGFFRLLSHALLCFDNSIPKEICQPVNIHFVLLPNILICHFYRIKNLHKKTGFKTGFGHFFDLTFRFPGQSGPDRYVNRLLFLSVFSWPVETLMLSFQLPHELSGVPEPVRFREHCFQRDPGNTCAAHGVQSSVQFLSRNPREHQHLLIRLGFLLPGRSRRLRAAGCAPGRKQEAARKACEQAEGKPVLLRLYLFYSNFQAGKSFLSFCALCSSK